MGKKIGIELNDVLRAYTEQFIYVYRKFIDPAAELKTEDITDADFSKSFPFKNRDEYTNFRYIDYPFELHARADECSKGLNAKFNMWTGRDLINAVEKDNAPEFILYSPLEANLTIQSTLSYLSANMCRMREIWFPVNSTDIWKRCDIVITANPTVLDAKPDGKVSVKINMPYNAGSTADHAFDSMAAVIDDPDRAIEKLLEE